MRALNTTAAPAGSAPAGGERASPGPDHLAGDAGPARKEERTGGELRARTCEEDRPPSTRGQGHREPAKHGPTAPFRAAPLVCRRRGRALRGLATLRSDSSVVRVNGLEAGASTYKRHVSRRWPLLATLRKVTTHVVTRRPQAVASAAKGLTGARCGAGFQPAAVAARFLASLRMTEFAGQQSRERRGRRRSQTWPILVGVGSQDSSLLLEAPRFSTGRGSCKLARVFGQGSPGTPESSLCNPCRSVLGPYWQADGVRGGT